MKRIFFLLLFTGVALITLGQNIRNGNDWYSQIADQPFIKILVTEDGVYRVTATQLSASDFDVSNVNPNTLRLFYRGEEVTRYINKNSDGSLNYLEFYGRRNDGRVDSLMYRDNIVGIHNASGQPNKEYSLSSDTSAYFLTYNSGRQGRRYFDYLNILYTGNPEDGYTYEGRLSFDPTNKNTTLNVVSGGSAYDSFNALNTDYIVGEGYVSKASFGQRDPVEFSIPTPGALNDGTAAKYDFRVFGRSNTTHRLRVSIDGASTPVIDTLWPSNTIYVNTYSRELTRNINNTTKLRFEALGNGPADNNHLCWASVSYRRNTNFNGEIFTNIKDFDKSTEAYFRFTNVDGNDTVIVYDLTTLVRSKGIINNGTAQVIVPSFGAGKRNLYVTTDKGIKTPLLQKPTLKKLFEPTKGADFVIITNRKLQASAEEYKNYRDTATVNPLKATIVYIDEIYDEFGYGSATPWAIKRFCKYTIDNWTPKPRYFMMWGKGSDDIRESQFENLVPSFGFPVSDHEFVSNFRFDRVNIKPEAAIGRVNIRSDKEGRDFLFKLNEYEHMPFSPWMKEGVFLGGGASVGEQSAIGLGIKNFISNFEDISFGGNYVYFQKQNNNTTITGDTYHDRISEGVSVIHFFGHSSSNILDVSIRNADGYNNFRRYPFMVAMGCFGGDFTAESSFGERWVAEPKRGAIGYLANSSAGYLSPLKTYGEIFYQIRHNQMPLEPIGDIISATMSKYSDSVPGIQTRNHCRQMNLQGDPSVVIKYPTKVDLAISETSVFFNPLNFTAEDVNYDMNLIVNNYGMAVDDSFSVRVVQRLPDGSSYEHPRFRFRTPAFRDTFVLPHINPVESRLAGRNTYDIWVDSDEEYEEYSEENNRINLTKIVPGNIPAILYPGEFAVVGEAQNHLDASAFFITRDDDVRYFFEIDTTANFNSPSKVNSGNVTGKAGYVRWDLPFLLQDSTVYFWRVRLVDVEPSFWGTSSFRYLEDRTGWAQAKEPQFELNETDKVDIDLVRKRWDFDNYAVDFEFELSERASSDLVFSMTVGGEREVDGIVRDYYVVGVIDGQTLEPVFPGGAQSVANPASNFNLVKQWLRSAKEGDYVVISAVQSSHVAQWDEEMYDLLSDIGVSGTVRSMSNDPFLFFGRKGSPVGTATEIYKGVGDKNRHFINKLLTAPYHQAEISSPRIGPAMKWAEAWWDWKSLDQNVQENAQLDLIAIRKDGEDSVFAENIGKRDFYDLQALDSERFPYVQFALNITDSVNFTAPQLDNWHVFFEAAPDAVIDPATNFAFESDTIQEGQDIYIRLGAENVTPFDMDSMLVRFTLIRSDRSTLILDSIRTAPLLGGGNVEFDYRFNTNGKDLKGVVDLEVEINPGLDQPERNTFNNVFVQPFYVKADRTNPMIDVTFDGKHIIDGDIISPIPEIVIELKDENEFIALADSTILEIQFGPNSRSISTPPEKISLSDPRVTFIPGELPENRARIIFRPGLFEPLAEINDGYILRLNGADAAENTTGSFNTYYEVTFKVIDESTITHVLNYPNPFSTNTRFVYTLTGSELPEVFQIHVYTISGKIVKVVDLVELGEVKFGNNITEYAWDGTDEFGDKLANGVYLYRVILKLPGEELEINGESTSKYFKNGWGKMYIMR
ncbi:MAG: C25 family cysteine peptidase [Bacteroidia bacterium]